MDSRMVSRSQSADSAYASSSSSRSTSPNPPRETTSSGIAPPPLPPALPALVLRKMIAIQLVQTGFEAADAEAIEFLEGSLYSFFETLVRFSHDLAELGRRHEPTLEDVVEGCRRMGLVESSKDLTEQALQALPPTTADLSIRYAKSTRRHQSKSPLMLPSDDDLPAFSDPEPDSAFESPPPSPKLLNNAFSSDHDAEGDSDEEFEEVLPLGADGQPIPTSSGKEAKDSKKKEKAKLRTEREDRRKERERRRKAREFRKQEYGKTFEADWAPKLPPKHSWKQTPVFPEQPPPPPIPAPVSRVAQSPSSLALSHLSTLRSRLNDSQLVASSLRNLIRRTGAAARGNPSSYSSATLSTSTSTAIGGDSKDQPTTAEEAAVAAEVAAEQEADLISYENEWYGSNKTIAKSAANFKKGKRHVRIIKVDDRRNREDGYDEDSEEDETRDGGSFAATAGGGGGVAKRRRWLV